MEMELTIDGATSKDEGKIQFLYEGAENGLTVWSVMVGRDDTPTTFDDNEIATLHGFLGLILDDLKRSKL